ncbi:FAD:protein FMN transferase [uncultured Roseobacter sp.]|uniref:FAD:protein FMN transferase n=1 Tax=uncultured Roseobacter sp. TaxID=114847 RepID=UPI00261F7DDC|nr:FAD:protein FMN transferase [uncultured Roseobacter sp.]
MRLSRRRFIAISAGFACVPATAQASTWRGRAFGADVAITLNGPRAQTEAALTDARRALREIEALFSLYDPGSALSQLNRTGQLHQPDPRFFALMQASDTAYHLTDGLFDPTVQPLWQASATGGNANAARARVGWERVTFTPEAVTLERGQAITFNGIAQGFATDAVASGLQRRGFREALINIGEFRALAGPWRLGLSDPRWGHLGNRTLQDHAIATSSPGALHLGHEAHILHPAARPHWSSVSVEAATATLADSLSTALVLTPLAQIRSIKDARPGLGRITLVSPDGDLSTV